MSGFEEGLSMPRGSRIAAIGDCRTLWLMLTPDRESWNATLFDEQKRKVVWSEVVRTEADATQKLLSAASEYVGRSVGDVGFKTV